MARRTLEEAAAAARQKWQKKFEKALQEHADDPEAVLKLLDISTDWLKAALHDRMEAGKRDAADLYKESAQQIAGFAKQIHELTEKGN